MTIETVFGTVEIAEVQPSDFLSDVFEKQKGPEWLAIFVEGPYEGVRAESWTQSKALKELMLLASARYAAELQDKIDGI